MYHPHSIAFLALRPIPHFTPNLLLNFTPNLLLNLLPYGFQNLLLLSLSNPSVPTPSTVT